MLDIQTRTTISVLHVSADDWELYDLDGRDDAALRMNAAIYDAVNNSTTRREAERLAIAALDAERYYGASDSEGWSMLNYIMTRVYGD
jgi:hypothetical protein